jgi:hypothetical protein
MKTIAQLFSSAVTRTKVDLKLQLKISISLMTTCEDDQVFSNISKLYQVFCVVRNYIIFFSDNTGGKNTQLRGM